MTERPRLPLELSPIALAYEVLALLGLVIQGAMVIVHWPDLTTVPRHFDFQGQPDSWGTRWDVFLVYGVNLVVYVLLTVLNRFPHRFNYPFPITPGNARGQYRLARTLLSAVKFFVVITLGWILMAMIVHERTGSGLGKLFLPAVIGVGLMIPLVYYLAARRVKAG